MNDCFFDDPVFPRTISGKRMAGIFEGADDPKKEEVAKGPDDPISTYAEQQARSLAMSAVLSWNENGEYTYEALEECVVGVCDFDADMEISDDEEAFYNDVWSFVPNALLSLGAEEDDVEALVEGEDDKAAAKVGNAVSTWLNEEEADTQDIIMGFTFGEEPILESASEDPARQMILEGFFKKVIKFIHGKRTIGKKRIGKAQPKTAAQKSAIRKMLRFASKGLALIKRKKSMKKRRQAGF